MKTTKGVETRYSCRCAGKSALRRPDIFTKRKLYLVIVADTVSVKHAEKSDTLDITINYDLYKLLLLANINETYAKHRIKELSELKKLISCQNLQFASDSRLPFKYIKIDYFMTANPLLIKLKILERFIKYCDPITGSKRVAPLSESNLITTIYHYEKAPAAFSGGVLQSILKPRTPLYNYLITKKGIVFYLNLLRFCLQGTNKKNTRYAYFIETYRGKNLLYYDAISLLIKDCFEQYNRSEMIKKADEKSDDKLYHSISVYTKANNCFNRYEAKPDNLPHPYISYFEDIMLFYKMNQLLTK